MKIFISVSAAPRFTPGQKVALREANNKWLAGKITEVSSHGVTFKSNDGDEFDIDGKELRWVRAITKSGKRTPYSNEEIKPLFAVKEPVPKERPKVAPAGSDKAVGVRAARTYMKEASDRAARYTEKYLNVKDAGTIQSHIAKKIRNGDYGLLEWKDKKDAAQVKANWSKIYKDEKALITQAKGAGGKFKIPKETEAPAPAVAEPPKAERKPRTPKAAPKSESPSTQPTPEPKADPEPDQGSTPRAGKENMKWFADRVTNRLGEMAKKIRNIRSKRMYVTNDRDGSLMLTLTDTNPLRSMIRENSSIWTEDKAKEVYNELKQKFPEHNILFHWDTSKDRTVEPKPGSIGQHRKDLFKAIGLKGR